MTTWINTELNERGWSQRELARRSGLSNTTISKVASETIPPTFDFCAAVARAFNEPPEKIFRLAGLLPSLPTLDNDITLREIWDTVRNMDHKQRQDALKYVRYLYHIQEVKKNRED